LFFVLAAKKKLNFKFANSKLRWRASLPAKSSAEGGSPKKQLLFLPSNDAKILHLPLIS